MNYDDAKDIISRIKHAIEGNDWFEIEGCHLKPFYEYIIDLQDQLEKTEECRDELLEVNTSIKKQNSHLENEILNLRQQNQIISDLSLQNVNELNDKLNKIVLERNKYIEKINKIKKILENPKVSGSLLLTIDQIERICSNE